MKLDQTSRQPADRAPYQWFVSFSIWVLSKHSLAQLNKNREYTTHFPPKKRPISFNSNSILKYYNSAEDQLPPYDVAISPDMVSRLENCLQELDIAPVNLRNAPMGENKEISLLVN